MYQHLRGIGSFLVGMAGGLVELALADAKRGLKRVNPDEPDMKSGEVGKLITWPAINMFNTEHNTIRSSC